MASARWTEEDFAAYQAKRGRSSRAVAPTKEGSKKQPKYRNEKTEMDGFVFDSKREADAWRDLKIEERTGAISNLRRQVEFSLSVGAEHICKYRADFVYDRDGVRCVVDAKGKRTEVYRIKKRLMAACHGIEVIEV